MHQVNPPFSETKRYIVNPEAMDPERVQLPSHISARDSLLGYGDRCWLIACGGTDIEPGVKAIQAVYPLARATVDRQQAGRWLRQRLVTVPGPLPGDVAEGYGDGTEVLVHIRLQGAADELFTLEDSRSVEEILHEELARRGAASSLVHREEHMQSKNVTDITVDTANLAIVANMRSQDLDELENVIHVRRLQLMAARLEANGFAVMVQHHNVFFDMLLVGVPGVTAPAEWATLSECRRLLDTVHNLPPAEAFARWREKIQPVAEEPYTEAQARADVRREREELRHRYEAGEIDSGTYADLYKAARTYLDLAEK